MQACYIYVHPTKEVIVLNHNDRKIIKTHNELIEEGYKLKASVDPSIIIQNLCNASEEDIIKEINKLKELAYVSCTRKE